MHPHKRNLTISSPPHLCYISLPLFSFLSPLFLSIPSDPFQMERRLSLSQIGSRVIVKRNNLQFPIDCRRRARARWPIIKRSHKRRRKEGDEKHAMPLSLSDPALSHTSNMYSALQYSVQWKWKWKNSQSPRALMSTDTCYCRHCFKYLTVL